MTTKKQNLPILRLVSRAAMTLLLCVLTSASAWADITINSATDWDTFATNVSNGTSYSGQTVTLAADITVSTMAGSSQANSFKGTFDGGEHTLTFNYIATADNAAPFAYIDGATIQNLHVDGTIQTSAKYAAGIAAQEYGTTTTIKNCRSSIVVKSNVSGDGTHGGFVAVNNSGTLTIEGCVFDGKLLTTNGTNNCGGFVGWKNGTLNIKNSIYNPAEIATGETEVLDGSGQYMSKTFARIDANTITNCFYTRILGSAQGKQPRSITAGNNVTIESIALTGTSTNYSVSGITAYSGGGLSLNGTLYYGNGDNVSLTISGNLPEDYMYIASAGNLTGSGNPYTLNMPDANVTISAASPINEISSVDDWNAFCAFVNSGHNYSGETITLTADIATATTKAGTSETTPFKGTFDGQGHTLTVNIASSNNQGNAPFQNIEGATIKNLTVEGTVTAGSGNDNRHAGGLVGFVRGNGTNTFQNCLVKTTVDSSSDYAGGIIGHGLSSNIVMEGCAYTGEIKATGTSYVGGLIGWSDALAGLTITDCLFAGTYTNSNSSKNFHPIGCTGNANNISSRTITNTYYTLDNINLNNDTHTLVYNLANQGKHGYTISGGTGVTVANAGTETTYGGNNVTHFVTGYGTGIGLTPQPPLQGEEGEVLYAGNQDNVSLTISGTLPEGYEYSASAGTLSGNSNPYTLTMPNSNITISITPSAIPEIGSQDDWEAFCASVNGGNNYSGKTVTLTGDVTVGTENSPVSGSDYMAGTSNNKFKGTFDGGGHTLTFNYSINADNAAPFGYLEGATIKNLHVDGTIQTSAKYAAGIAAHTYGTTSITNCQSSIVVKSSVSGDGTHGGFVGVDESGTLDITGCLFNGKLLTTNGTIKCGGFVGYKSGNLNISNSLYAPATPADGETWVSTDHSATFARNGVNTISNSYYTTDFNDGTNYTTQGKQPRSITAGENVTIESIALTGNPTNYNVSGITAYSGGGLSLNGILYYGNGDNVSLTISGNLPEGYVYSASAGTLFGSGNSYTLNMPDADVTISIGQGANHLLFENFDNMSSISTSYSATDWYAYKAGSGNYWTLNSSSDYANSGSKSAQYSYNNSYAADAYLVSAPFTTSASMIKLEVSLYERVYDSSNQETFEVFFVKASDVTSAADVASATHYDAIASASYSNTSFAQKTGSVTHSALAGQSVRVVVHCTSAKNMWNLYIDDIVVTETIQPSGPYITLDPTSATVLTGFTQTLTASYGNITGTPTITYSSSNTNVATVSGSGTTATVTGESAGTATITATMTYNGNTYTGECPITVEDPSYCTPSGYGSNADCIVRFVLGDINNQTASSSTNGYGDYTNLSTSFDPEETATATVYGGDGSGNHAAALWIDFNNNYEFESSERVGTTSSFINPSSASSGDITFTIPTDAPAGSHRLRVKYEYGTNVNPTNFDPCTSSTSYGEVEDYTIVINAIGAYTVTCATTTGGTISADKTSADENDMVTITAMAETDYLLTALTYTPEGGSAQDITFSGNSGTFTMPAANVTVNATFTQSACPRPTNLTVSNLAASHATVSWDSEAGNYTVQYSTATVTGTTLDPVFEDGFENGMGNWTIYAMGYNGSDYNWQQYDGTLVDEGNHTGDHVAASRSWTSSGGDQSVDNWLVTPQMTLGDVVKFWVACNDGYRDSYAVYVSTGSNVDTSSSSIGDFVLVKSYAEATGTWTEISVDISAYAGQQGYVAIRHTNYGGDHIMVDDFGVYNTINTYSYGTASTLTTTENSCELTGLSPETLYEVQVQANYGGTDGNSAWSSVRFTTPDNCGAPQELAASNITATSATLSWADDKDSYNLQYRKVYYYEDFEGSDGIPTGWTTINNSTTAGSLNWQVLHLNNHSGNNSVGSGSYIYQNTGITPDNWLISPQLDLQGTLRVWLSGYGERYSEHFEILLSTTGNSASDFTTTLVAESTTTNSYVEYTADLSSYAGQKGYIAIHHFNCSDQNYLCVDDFGLYGSEDWVTLSPNPTTETANLTDLTPNTGYEWQVQGVNCDGNGGTTEWSEVSTFTTLLLDLELADNDSEKPADEKNAALLTKYNGQKASVTLSGRKLYKDGLWNTLCLPFSMTAAQVTAQLNPTALMELDITGKYVWDGEKWSTDDNGTYQTKLDTDGTLYLFFKDASSITAGVPYIIKWAEGNDWENPVFSGVTINDNASTEVDFTGGKFKGNYSPVNVTADESILFMGANNTLYYPHSARTINAFRAWFDLGSNNAREFRLNFGENEQTSVKWAMVNGQWSMVNDESWYTLDGRKLDGKPATKGLYIYNGRKVAIK